MNSSNYLVYLNIGDWSGDGHDKNERFYFTSNYNVSTIRQAYKNSCKLTGLQFNHNENYTNNENIDRNNLIFTEYEEDFINEDVINILEKHGIDINKYLNEDSCYVDEHKYYFYRYSSAELIMEFIGLSMPKDWKYNIYTIEVEPINGEYNSELNVQFGYGLFYE